MVIIFIYFYRYCRHMGTLRWVDYPFCSKHRDTLKCDNLQYLSSVLDLFLPISGTDSDVAGVVADTMFKNKVSDSRIVISASLIR